MYVRYLLYSTNSKGGYNRGLLVFRDEMKLKRSGELIYFGSEQILDKVNALLEKSQQSQVDETDTKIDRSFTDFLSSLTSRALAHFF